MRSDHGARRRRGPIIGRVQETGARYGYEPGCFRPPAGREGDTKLLDTLRALGLELDLSDLGLGVRCRRFAAVLDDGVFRHVAVEPGRGITVCGAEHLLERLDRAPF